MAIPVVAIVGRPNVGKSSVLNWLAGRRVSIVEPTPGVTRDRVSAICHERGCYFELVDTGGFGISERDELGEQIEQQIRFAVGEAQLVLLVVDVQAGLVALDAHAAELLRRAERAVIVVANKADSVRLDGAAGEFCRLGFGEPVVVSTVHSRNRAELVEAIVGRVGTEGEAPGEPVMKVAVVGKRNVGKSTLINALAGAERVIVSELPGTTRDSIDVRFARDGRVFVAIDTAGLRKRRKVADEVEFFSHARTRSSIRRADVVLLLIDAAEAIGEVDKKLAAFVEQQYKPCVLVVNKWDLTAGRAGLGKYKRYLRESFPGLDYAPVVSAVANRGEGIDEAIATAEGLFQQGCARVSTGLLNRAVEAALARRAPPARRGTKRVKIYYATQASTAPPTIVLFVNDPGLVDEQYRRFLVRRFRELLPFGEVPIRLLLRSHRAEPARARGRRG